jgi:hypothetical protein
MKVIVISSLILTGFAIGGVAVVLQHPAIAGILVGFTVTKLFRE